MSHTLNISSNLADFPAETLEELAQLIKKWGQELGFQQVGITDCDLSQYTADFSHWLAEKFHGTMAYMAQHGSKRYHPDELIPGTLRIICVRIDYLPPQTAAIETLQDSNKAYISRYALGGDYHRFIRKKLDQLAARIQQEIGPFGYRAFSDSAPILEKPLAEKAGLGWIGKNTLLLSKEAGSWFFLGELFTDLPLPIDGLRDGRMQYAPTPLQEQTLHSSNKAELCGKCVACINICPTRAIIAPAQLDARKCISYLTIEHQGSIPEEYRALMGNRIYGCDDCQLVCPWNRYAKASNELQFHARDNLANADLVELFLWSEPQFLEKTKGSAIRRLGYERWLRNVAIALGNAPTSAAIVAALTLRCQHDSELVREHAGWALERHRLGKNQRADVVVAKLSAKMNENY
ncbi:MAG: tRNA epoxyqueuosine(34) reductase QueG [Gammaproteobacteria bacterium]